MHFRYPLLCIFNQCASMHKSIDAPMGGQHLFEKLVNKNAIKPKTGGPPPPWQFFLKALTPPRDFGKNFKYTLPWTVNPCASMYKSNIHSREITAHATVPCGLLSFKSLFTI